MLLLLNLIVITEHLLLGILVLHVKKLLLLLLLLLWLLVARAIASAAFHSCRENWISYRTSTIHSIRGHVVFKFVR